MIKMLIMDVDGTLTDGGIYMGETGEIAKRFDVKDGYGIHNILKQHNIVPVIITGRKSQILENRCRELEINDIVQDCSDKVCACKNILEKYSLDYTEVAYIGDDLNDYEVMNLVGLRGCPADAAKKIKEISNFVAKSCGGHGAVRDFIDWIVDGED